MCTSKDKSSDLVYFVEKEKVGRWKKVFKGPYRMTCKKKEHQVRLSAITKRMQEKKKTNSKGAIEHKAQHIRWYQWHVIQQFARHLLQFDKMLCQKGNISAGFDSFKQYSSTNKIQ